MQLITAREKNNPFQTYLNLLLLVTLNQIPVNFYQNIYSYALKQTHYLIPFSNALMLIIFHTLKQK